MPVGLRCVLVWLLLARLAGGADVRPVTLGLVAPPGEWDATSLQRGVQLAVAEANDAGGGPVGLEVRSEAGQWGSTGNDAVTLICERRVDAIITPSDGAASHLILQVAGRTRVPVASVCSDSSVTEAGVPWAVRVVPRTDQEAGALFAAAQRPDRAPIRWWAVIPADRPGRPVRRDLETAARVSATQLDRIIEDDDAKIDIVSLARTIAGAAPGGLLLWLPPARAGRMVAALRAAGYRGRLAGPSTLNSPAFVAAAGGAAAGVLTTGAGTDPDLARRAGEFAAQYRRRFGAEPDFSAAAAHDAARVLIETLWRAGNGAGFRQFPLALPATGVTGVIHFDNSGNRTDALQVLTFQQGRFVPIPPTEA